MKKTVALRASLLFRDRNYPEALKLYKILKEATGGAAWDWHIGRLEKLLNLERTTFLKRELCSILEDIAGIEKIYVANLKHRKTRKKRIILELNKFGIDFDKLSIIEAFDAANNERAQHLFEKFKYADTDRYKSIASIPVEILNHDRINSSPGVIGYLLTQEIIFEDAIINGYKRILVLDDDIFFATNASAIAFKFFSNITNWKIVHLGSSEHSAPECEYLHERLSQAKKLGYYYPVPYKTCGSFAVAYDSSIFCELLPLIKESVGVYDRAILSYFYKAYPTECFTLRPAACGADVSESDIREDRNMREHAIQMGWDMSRYEEYLSCK